MPLALLLLLAAPSVDRPRLNEPAFHLDGAEQRQRIAAVWPTPLPTTLRPVSLQPRSVLAGFSLPVNRDFAVHVCGPEVSVTWAFGK